MEVFGRARAAGPCGLGAVLERTESRSDAVIALAQPQTLRHTQQHLPATTLVGGPMRLLTHMNGSDVPEYAGQSAGAIGTNPLPAAPAAGALPPAPAPTASPALPDCAPAAPAAPPRLMATSSSYP